MPRNARPIMSKKQIWGALVVLTLLAIGISLILSVLALYMTTTGDPDAPVPASEVWTNVLIFSAVIPGIVCPLVVYTLLSTMRELNIARAELDAIAKRDPLTGLLNRRGLDAAAADLIPKALISRKNVSLLMCDIDFFKRINDTHGHDAGDAVIRHVAFMLTQVMAEFPDAAVGRQGGEEFAVLVTGLSTRAVAQCAESIRKAVEAAPATWQEGVISATVSVGFTHSLADEAELKPLFTRADLALYEAKKRGRNRVEFAGLALAA